MSTFGYIYLLPTLHKYFLPSSKLFIFYSLFFFFFLFIALHSDGKSISMSGKKKKNKTLSELIINVKECDILLLMAEVYSLFFFFVFQVKYKII